MAERVTYKRLKEWIKIHNDNWTFKVELSAFNDCYYIYDAETHNMIVSAETPGKCWELFYIYRSGYCKALELVRAGKVDINE